MKYRTFLPYHKKVILQVLVISVVTSYIFNVNAKEVTNSWDESQISSFTTNNFESSSISNSQHVTQETVSTETFSIEPTSNSLLDDSLDYPATRAQPIRIESTDSPNSLDCGPVRSLTHNVTKTKIEIGWVEPANMTYCNGEYLIELIDSDDQTVVDSKTTREFTTEFSELDYCESYIYRITPYDSDNERGDSNERSFKTDNVAPSEVTNFTYNSSSSVETAITSVVISWDVPEFGKECVSQYEILMWRRDRESEEEPNIVSENTTSRSVSRTEMTACEVYFVKITPIVDENIRGEDKTFTVAMAARLPVAPSKTERESYGPNFLNLSTVNNDIKSVCYPSIAKFMCTYDGDDPEAEKV